MNALEMLVAMQGCVMPDTSAEGRRRRCWVVTAEIPGPGMVILRCGPTAADLDVCVREAFARWSKATSGRVS